MHISASIMKHRLFVQNPPGVIGGVPTVGVIFDPAGGLKVISRTFTGLVAPDAGRRRSYGSFGAVLTRRENSAEADAPVLSRTVMPGENVPDLVGVPPKSVERSSRPSGIPSPVKAYGGVPPSTLTSA